MPVEAKSRASEFWEEICTWLIRDEGCPCVSYPGTHLGSTSAFVDQDQSVNVPVFYLLCMQENLCWQLAFLEKKWKLRQCSLLANRCMHNINDFNLPRGNTPSWGWGPVLEIEHWREGQKLAVLWKVWPCAMQLPDNYRRARQCRDPVNLQPLSSAVIRRALWINNPVKGNPLECLFV